MHLNNNNKGVVLISVLLIVLLLSSIAVMIGNNFLISLKRASYLEFQTNSLNIFRNVESIALKKIDIELRFNANNLNKMNPLLTNDLIFESDKGMIIGKITDSSSCFNINTLVKKSNSNYIENMNATAAFRKIMNLYEVDNNTIEEMIDQIIDWIDLDSNPRAYGLEDYFYSGPLNNPKEYSGMRLFFSINELKGIPATRKVDWTIFEDNFCASYDNSNITFNINTLDLSHSFLLSSIFPNISNAEAEFIIDSLPQEGIQSMVMLEELFPGIDFTSPNGDISFSSKSYKLQTIINYEDFSSESISKIYYGANKNSYIVSRIYNGI
jgi:type II secretory pathway component PulK